MSFDIRNITGTPIREDKMHLMRRIRLFMKRTAMTPTRFGREAIGDPRLITDLQNGRELRETTAARIHAWLDSQEKRA
jgi:hypothetical protein